MRLWTYLIVAIVFNYLLYNTFPWGEDGGALMVFITIPLIIILSFILTFIHYLLNKRGQYAKYFQLPAVALVVLVSYLIFPTENSPMVVIGKMIKVANNYSSVSINDYFLERRYENYEKIIAAKRKFIRQLADTAYSVNISNKYDYRKVYQTYGINFFNDRPYPTNDELIVESSEKLYMFTDYLLEDTISFTGDKNHMHVKKSRSDSFTEFGKGHFQDSTLKQIDIDLILKEQTPDESLWAYKMYYWLLPDDGQ